MKVLRALLSLSVLYTAYAAPSGKGTYASEQSPHSAGVAQAELEKRITAAQCTSVAKAIWARTTLEVANIFVTKTSNFIKGVCTRHESKGCAVWVDDVTEGFQLIFDVGYVYKYGSVAVDASNAYMSSRSLPSDDASSSVEDMLKLSGYSYDSVEIITFPSDGITTRDNEPALISRHILKNVKHRESKKSHDYTIHQFADGNTHFHIPFENSGNTTSSKAKRHNGSGVKISFKHEKLSLVASSDSRSASAAIASRWQEHAEAGHSDVFGFVEQQNKALFYYRTTVEGDGFGDNYESVDACGDMSHLVSTYLGPGN
ncbi:unnamed protein product [Penicillium salamii]|uniref:Uncharacterized protein n=1 Tax=Penicillium salamii TaxID=1612424 RepID=A0A9W4JG49_9EURO|nr:unnamed protein product [Penicillium salamii]CAG8175865.1 unnamed protein product [Penicillium salamii]CAG8206460.1 unnamed protein product [Penicillium salamii]CAG8235991.1 unnamed protein product [Penicillium salamii]CAG8306090.1 unnamed protein product [Penicillium salamii]